MQKVKLMTFLIDSNFVIFVVIVQLLSLGNNVRQDVFCFPHLLSKRKKDRVWCNPRYLQNSMLKSAI